MSLEGLNNSWGMILPTTCANNAPPDVSVFEQSVSMILLVLLETMLCLLSLELNNSWSMFFISSMGDHAPLLDTRVEPQVEHGFNKFYGKQCNPCCHDG